MDNSAEDDAAVEAILPALRWGLEVELMIGKVRFAETLIQGEDFTPHCFARGRMVADFLGIKPSPRELKMLRMLQAYGVAWTDKATGRTLSFEEGQEQIRRLLKHNEPGPTYIKKTKRGWKKFKL